MATPPRPPWLFCIGAAVLSAAGALVPSPAAAAPWLVAATTANPLACEYHKVASSAPQVFKFTRSTEMALVNYVGKRCLTVTFTGGPSNPNPTARSIGSVTYVDLDSQTAYWVGGRPATISALRPGAQLLSLTATGRYTLFLAIKVVILPKGAQLPA